MFLIGFWIKTKRPCHNILMLLSCDFYRKTHKTDWNKRFGRRGCQKDLTQFDLFHFYSDWHFTHIRFYSKINGDSALIVVRREQFHLDLYPYNCTLFADAISARNILGKERFEYFLKRFIVLTRNFTTLYTRENKNLKKY